MTTNPGSPHDPGNPGDPAELRLRRLFADAAGTIHPTRRAPGADPASTPIRRPGHAVGFRLAVTSAVCLVLAAVVLAGVRPWASKPAGLPPGVAAGDAFLAIRSDGSVQLLSPETGATIRTLVSPSPVDTAGHHLSRPYAVAASANTAYIAYLAPSPVIDSVPLGGGTLTAVAAGMYPAVDRTGTELAFLTTPSTGNGGETTNSTQDVVVENLADGAQRTVYAESGAFILTGLSWSADGDELAIAGDLLGGGSRSAAQPLLGIEPGVEILRLDRPVSSSNPRFFGRRVVLNSQAPVWSGFRFVGRKTAVAVLAMPPGGLCPPASTQVLALDTDSGATTTIATVPFRVEEGVFDPAGSLVAVVRSVPNPPCSQTTTTSTTTTTTARPGSSESTGGGSITANQSLSQLDLWSGEQATELAGGVDVATLVHPGS